MKTKFLAVLMALVTMTALASGCGGSKKQDGTPVSVTVGKQTKEPVATEAPTPEPENNIVLDETYRGTGYQISYPSDYTTQDNNGAFTITDPASGSSVAVQSVQGVGSIEGLTSQDMKDILSENGMEVDITDFYETTFDGYKAYAFKYDMPILDSINIAMTEVILGDGTDMYVIACGLTSIASDETEDILDAIADSFEVV